MTPRATIYRIDVEIVNNGTVKYTLVYDPQFSSSDEDSPRYTPIQAQTAIKLMEEGTPYKLTADNTHHEYVDGQRTKKGKVFTPGLWSGV